MPVDESHYRLRQRLPGLLACLLVAAPALWGIREGVVLMRADLRSMAARDAVDRWARGSDRPTEAQVQQAETALLQALTLTPDDAVLHDTLAQLHTTLGLAVWDDPVRRVQSFERARDSQQASLALRPASGATWAALASSLWVTGQPVAQVHDAWRQTVRHAPREVVVERVLFDLAFATWDEAPSDIRQWALERWHALPQSARPGIRAIAARHGRTMLLD